MILQTWYTFKKQNRTCQHCWQTQTVQYINQLTSHEFHINGLEQKRCNSSAFALELHLFSTDPSTYTHIYISHENNKSMKHTNGLVQGCYLQCISNGDATVSTMPPMHGELRVVIKANSLLALWVVITTTCGVASHNIAGTMTTHDFRCTIHSWQCPLTFVAPGFHFLTTPPFPWCLSCLYIWRPQISQSQLVSPQLTSPPRRHRCKKKIEK